MMHPVAARCGCRSRFPLLENVTTRRSGCPGPSTPIVESKSERVRPSPAGSAHLTAATGSHLEYFAQQLINGLVLGSIYGLIAIGYTMVYGIVGMINFAHGDIFMIGGFIALIAFLILVSIGLTTIPVILLLVLLVAMAITALYGWTVERIAYRPLRQSFRLAPMLSAIGMSFVLSNFAQVAQGARRQAGARPVIQRGYTLFESDGFVVRLSRNIQIIVVVTTVGVPRDLLVAVARTGSAATFGAQEQEKICAALACGRA